MFCGELDGDLVTAHIASRADDARKSIADMFAPGPLTDGWALAKKEGWRVVPVVVSRATR